MEYTMSEDKTFSHLLEKETESEAYRYLLFVQLSYLEKGKVPEPEIKNFFYEVTLTLRIFIRFCRDEGVILNGIEDNTQDMKRVTIQGSRKNKMGIYAVIQLGPEKNCSLFFDELGPILLPEVLIGNLTEITKFL